MSGTRIARRGVLALPAALLLPAAPAAAAPGLPVPRGDRLDFDVYRNGSRIGAEHVRFSRSGDELAVDSSVELAVRLLGVRVFHYRARIVEHWRHGAFQRARSTVNDNGTHHELAVERVAHGIEISGNRRSRYTAPADALPLSYWNKAMLGRPKINMQTGNTDRPPVAKEGWFRLAAEPSGTVRAEKYRLGHPLDVAVYYNRAGAWSGLEFHHDGHIVYRPVQS